MSLLVLFALAGCSSGGHPAQHPAGPPLVIPKPSASATGRPRPAGPGTVCGQITNLSGSPARVIVVRGRTTCVEALRVFRKYNDPLTPAEGISGLVVIDHWTCETRRTITFCDRRGTLIQARPTAG